MVARMRGASQHGQRPFAHKPCSDTERCACYATILCSPFVRRSAGLQGAKQLWSVMMQGYESEGLTEAQLREYGSKYCRECSAMQLANTARLAITRALAHCGKSARTNNADSAACSPRVIRPCALLPCARAHAHAHTLRPHWQLMRKAFGASPRNPSAVIWRRLRI